MQEIVVVGAGVIGLSAATLLQQKYPLITIVAQEFPTVSPATRRTGLSRKQHASVDYASMWAGAHYRPIPGSTVQLQDERQLAFATSQHMKKIARDFAVESGVQLVPAAEYLEEPPDDYTALNSNTAYAGHDDQFRVLTKEEIQRLNHRLAGTDEIRWACEYESYVVNVHLYCAWLLRRFQERGGRTKHLKLSDLSEAFESESPCIVINCSGRNFDKDPQMEIIRGQTILVRQEYNATRTRQNKDGSWSFLIPRPLGGGTIVGGTKEIGDDTSVACADTRQKLLANAARYFPDFVDRVEDFDVICDNVGRRPWRDGGIRLEAEQTPRGLVVHGYGAGGRGYELSWGVAERICELVDESCRAQKARL